MDIKIISGGQTGVDLGALEGARDCHIPTGGTAPPNWFSGGKPQKELLQSFGLDKLNEYDPKIYPKRSMKNVDDSDVTIAILWETSPGTIRTIGYCQTGQWRAPYPFADYDEEWKCPCLIIYRDWSLYDAAARAEFFIRKHAANVINFAGNREESQPGIQNWTRQLVKLIYERIRTPQI